MEKALDLAGAEPKDAVMVGDSPYDILAGNGAGCTTIAVTWGADSEETVKAAHPDHLVNKIDELESPIIPNHEIIKTEKRQFLISGVAAFITNEKPQIILQDMSHVV